MSQKVFKSQKNQIVLTDEFLVFDKNKSIHFDHLLVVKMNKGPKSVCHYWTIPTWQMVYLSEYTRR